MKAIRRFTVRTVLPESISGLGTLAANLRWSWHEPTARFFRELDPETWAAVREDPVALLGTFDRARLDALAADERVVEGVGRLSAELRDYLTEPRWYQGLDGSAPQAIAYFSPEYGITAALPQYSGGLGILAGDHLKAASDLGVPIIGVGLLYEAGYFKQSLSRDAWQQETYPVLDPHGLPLTMLREDDGTPAMVTLPLPDGRHLRAHIWRADVGRVPLLLLDADVPGNDDAARAITDRLYGGGGDHRLQQELLLGMGGVKALRAYSRITGNPAPEVFHTNEGHAGFLGVERIRELMDAGLSWSEALTAVRSSTVFTTHTPVPAGIDRFESLQVAHFLRAGLAPGVPTEDILSLGREDYAGGDPATFNMAVMGLRLAQRANGVAKLHGRVSRGMFAGLWAGFDTEEVPIGSVTNGVHVPTWVDPQVAEFVRGSLGSSDAAEPDWSRADELPDEDVWALRRRLRSQLIADVRDRLRSSWLKRGAAEAELAWTNGVLDPDVLTIGFARRVPTYKRLTLMLRDPARLKALLLHPERPIQLVIAGKSHPADEAGKKMIQDLVRFTDDPAVRHRIVFLPNYDMRMARTLFPGCDVWLNNPLRPLEACGTSGMKAAINGALNLSVMDGWWDEMYDGDNGWAIPTAPASASPEERDDIEAAALYALIENSVAPRFYGHEETAGAGAAGPSQETGDGVPRQWVRMIKHTLAELGPKVSAERMVQDYVNGLYVPAAGSGRAASRGDFAGARELADFTRRMRAAWSDIVVEHVDSVGISEEPRIGDEFRVNTYIRLGGIEPSDVAVQAVHGSVSESDELTGTSVTELSLAENLGEGRYLFSGKLHLERPGAFGYGVRVVPRHASLASDAELGLVTNAG
ncbi:MAG: alpha-glucan family phosphorylase [Arthrobacter sp.]|uniref:alpha-glucan family phosphorylase n=1 Tax=Arthrobacter sp. TaxID=1667 RepID=UPI0034855D75